MVPLISSYKLRLSVVTIIIIIIIIIIIKSIYTRRLKAKSH